MRRRQERVEERKQLTDFEEAACCLSAVVQRAARRKNGLCKRSARGNWDLRKANNYFGPTQKGSKTAPSR